MMKLAAVISLVGVALIFIGLWINPLLPLDVKMYGTGLILLPVAMIPVLFDMWRD
jgi:hypothetical protein